MKLLAKLAGIAGRYLRVSGCALSMAACATAASPQSSAASAVPERPTPASLVPARTGVEAGDCERATPDPWPSTADGRHAHLQVMESLRARCMDHPGFLAMLGGLLLEDGDAAEALVWLERSLLLDPGNLGAQADHALSLAALGEPQAMKELARAWGQRSDLPTALRARLFPQQSVNAGPVRLGRRGLPIMGLQREILLLVGYENNLDQSPRLTELTLTAPDGNLVLPVYSQPRRGAAAMASASLQGAYSPETGSIWRSGLTLATRNSPSQQRTDWSYVQWSASGVHQWAWWRSHLELGASWFAGPLNEPYRLLRAGVAADIASRRCRLRLGADAEQRRQSTTTAYDAVATGIQVGAQCPLDSLPSWAWSIVLRAAEDRPDTDSRPGGVQRQTLLGARLTGPLSRRWQVDLGMRASAVSDALGYSILLDNDARRHLQQRQISLELAYRPDDSFLAGAQAVLQLHMVRQRSNLPLFKYDAASLYSGLRWGW